MTEQGYSAPQAAESLGIRTNQLYQWKQKLEQSKQDSFLNSDEKSELITANDDLSPIDI